MPRDGNGNFSRTNGSFSGPTTWSQQADSADKTINAGRHDTHDEDIAGALTQSLSRDGQGPMTGNLPMGDNRIVDLAPGTETTDAITKQQRDNVIATGSTAARTPEARAADWVNVKDDGATGDGTTDDTAAKDAAEARRAARSAQRAWYPDGIYSITTAPDWSRIAGEGFIRFNGDDLPAGDIRQSITLNVPGTFATIQDAWGYLSTRRIVGSGVNATVQLADGTYNLTGPIVLNHSDGWKIRVLGNQTTPANVTLTFADPASDGFVVNLGNALQLIDGVTVNLAAKAEFPNVGIGILADQGSMLAVGGNTVVDNFYYGICARYGSFVECSSATVTNSGDVGIFGFVNGAIRCENASSTGADDAVRNLGYGVLSEFGGAINATGATGGGRLGGLASINSGVLRAAGTETGLRERILINHGRIQEIAEVGGTRPDVEMFPAANGFVRLGSNYAVVGGLSPNGVVPIIDATGQNIQLLARVTP